MSKKLLISLAARLKRHQRHKRQSIIELCELCEVIYDQALSRDHVIAIVRAANPTVSLETCASQASRILKLARNPGFVEGLMDGSLVIRESVYGRVKPNKTKHRTTGKGRANAPT